MSLEFDKLNRVEYVFDPPLTPARLLKRYKRFLADVRLESGQEATIHCPNSGSMLGCMEENAPIYMSPAKDPKRRTPYTWEMSYMNGGWVGINTGIPNILAARAAKLRALPLFEGALKVKREVKVSDHSRLDLMVELPKGPLYVEVKNVTLVRDGAAHFPDARTARGAKHLEELMKLKAAGARAAMFYLVQRSDGHCFGPARDIDPEYARLLARAMERGVEVIVVRAKVSPRRIFLERTLPLAMEDGLC